VNHGETLKLLAKSISQIAARLPRFKLVSKLYPTAQMRLAIETLYSCLLEFLIRAHGWCNESKLSHFYHSYTRPHELRYKDLLERVTACSNNIIELAAIGSQAELHLMHNTQDRKLDLIISLLEASGLTINDLVAQTVGQYPQEPWARRLAKETQHSSLSRRAPSLTRTNGYQTSNCPRSCPPCRFLSKIPTIATNIISSFATEGLWAWAPALRLIGFGCLLSSQSGHRVTSLLWRLSRALLRHVWPCKISVLM
jgi:hypothetical protein